MSNKYLLLEVPNFLGGDDGSLSSYLCLGQPGDALPPYGEDLAWVVTDFADDQRQREPAGAPGTTVTRPSGETYPGDDTTISTGLPKEDPLAADGRSALSSLLHTKGGWRDHSDGNRITTTRGDKVEVVRGNYRLVVLGRHDPGTKVQNAKPIAPSQGTAAGDPGGFATEEGSASDTTSTEGTVAAGTPPQGIQAPDDLSNAVSMDISGGVMDVEQYLTGDDGTSGTQSALSTEYVWSQDSSGRWGWTQRTRVGLYFDADKHTSPPGNGKTISYTWVDEAWAFRGSPSPDPAVETTLDAAEGAPRTLPNSWDPNNLAPQPLKMLWSQDWAETVYEETNAVAIQGSTVTPSLVSKIYSDGTLESDMTSQGNMVTSAHSNHGDMTNSVHADGHMSNNTSANSLAETFSTNTVHSVMNTALGILSEIDAAIALIAEIKLAVLMPEVRVGIHMEEHFGIHTEEHFGLHAESHIGWHTQYRTATMETKELHISSNVGTWILGLVSLGLGPEAPVPPDPATAAPAAPGAAGGATSGASTAGVSGAADMSNIGGLGVATSSAAPIGTGVSTDYVVAGLVSAGGLAGLGVAVFGKGGSASSSSSSSSSTASSQGTSKPASESAPLKTESEPTSTPTSKPATEADDDPKKPGPWEDL